MHPIGGRQIGWSDVQAAWRQVAQLASGGQVDLEDQHLHVAGDMACEAGVEQGQFKLAGEWVVIDHRVTNIYPYEAEGWKVIHHHADTSPAMQNVLRQAEAVSGWAEGLLSAEFRFLQKLADARACCRSLALLVDVEMTRHAPAGACVIEAQ